MKNDLLPADTPRLAIGHRTPPPQEAGPAAPPKTPKHESRVSKNVLTNEPKMGTFGLVMGTIEHKGLSSALFGKVRRVVLALFFSRPDESFYLRQIARMTGVGQGAVQRELKRLTEAGIITRTGQGRRVDYRVNRNCPLFDELQSLVTKTAGLADVLRKALAPLVDQIEIAFVYGSQANGTAGPTSDVDLLIVGDVDEMDLHRAIAKVEEQLDRTVNYTLLDRREFQRRRSEKGGFLHRVLSGQMIFIVGNPEDV
jgi:predicted nucleotidyltransferase